MELLTQSSVGHDPTVSSTRVSGNMLPTRGEGELIGASMS